MTPDPEPDPEPDCDCEYKCESAADAGSCEVCSADHNQCAQELTKPAQCDCEYKCEKAEDAGSCPVCSVEGAWENCPKASKPLDCTCEYQCSEDHEDTSCKYCAQADDCKQTKLWEQKYGKVTVTINWNDESNAFNSRYSALYNGVVSLQGGAATAKYSFTSKEGEGSSTVTI